MQKIDTEDWVKISEAARVTGKSERTLRRWASGKTKEYYLETRGQDGQMLVRLSDIRKHLQQDTYAPQTVQPKEPMQSGLKDQLRIAADTLRDKELEIVRLSALLQGKDELIEELRRSNEKHEQSINRLENALLQIQTALAAGRSDSAQESSAPVQAAKALVKDIDASLAKEIDTSYAIKTPLHFAANKGDVTKITALIKEGVSLNAVNNLGYTPLHYATMRGHIEAAEKLISSGGNIDLQGKDGWTALHLAALGNHAAIAKMLVFRGADTDISDNTGNSPLHIAAANGNDRVVEVLLSAMANPNSRNEDGKTPLTLAIEASAVNTAQIIKSNGGIE